MIIAIRSPSLGTERETWRPKPENQNSFELIVIWTGYMSYFAAIMVVFNQRCASKCLTSGFHDGCRGRSADFVAFADFHTINILPWLTSGYQGDVTEEGVGKICSEAQHYIVFPLYRHNGSK